ncbi:MAG: hypothetical protein JWO60_1284 [Frankiales bacterium]|nr:hypothetical protein [Frankiales bacterium]
MSAERSRLVRSPSGRTVVVTPVGVLDASAAAALRESLEAAAASGARVVVVDLQAAPGVEPVVCTVLVEASGTLRASGRALLVVNVLPHADRALRASDRTGELRVVPLERLLTPAWLEDGALSLPQDAD